MRICSHQHRCLAYIERTSMPGQIYFQGWAGVLWLPCHQLPDYAKQLIWAWRESSCAFLGTCAFHEGWLSDDSNTDGIAVFAYIQEQDSNHMRQARVITHPSHLRDSGSLQSDVVSVWSSTCTPAAIRPGHKQKKRFSSYCSCNTTDRIKHHKDTSRQPNSRIWCWRADVAACG